MLTCVEKLINKKQGTRFTAQKREAVKKVQVADHKNKTFNLYLESCALIKTLVRCGSKFQQPIELFRRKIIIKEIDGIDLLPVFMHFIMAMWPR